MPETYLTVNQYYSIDLREIVQSVCAKNLSEWPQPPQHIFPE